MSSSNQSFETTLNQALTNVLNSNFDAESKVCLVTILKLLDNLLKQPDNPKVRTIRLSNKTIQSKIVRCNGVPVLLACGFEEKEQQRIMENQSESILTLPLENEDISTLVKARRMINFYLTDRLNVSADELPAMPTPMSRNAPGNNPDFNIYEGHRYDGKSAAVGTSLNPPSGWKSQTEKQIDILQEKQERIENQFRKKAGGEIQRQWIATSPSSRGMATASNRLVNDSAAQPSDSALLARHAQKQAQERQAAENRGFTTKAMRDLEQLKKKKVYSHTVLAISFPDGYIVKGNFWPREKVSAVIQSLLSDVLVEGAMDFDLYITPPRTKLEPSKTLEELNLIPAAKIHVSWKAPMPQREEGWYIVKALTANDGAKKSLPEAVSLETDEKTKDGSISRAGKSLVSSKPKKSKADKEADLLKKMMGR